MPALTDALIRSTLSTVAYPGFSRDIVSFGLVRGVEIAGDAVTVSLQVTTADASVPPALRAAVEAALRALPGVERVEVRLEVSQPSFSAQNAVSRGAGTAGSASVPGAGAISGSGATSNTNTTPGTTPGAGVSPVSNTTGTVTPGLGPLPGVGVSEIPGVQRVIAIASGKGGVGKSTVAANLAVALQQTGAKVGLCDCDLYGPSIGMMFGVRERPFATEDNVILPLESAGVKLMSMGFLLDDDAPAVLRGPMVTRYTQQFLRQVEWGPLDWLLLDLPPGTGDIQLTVVQTVALAGAVIVTTPQEVALADARKAVSMFGRVNVPILGLVENMSYFLCPSDGVRYDIFGTGGGQREAARQKVPFLGEIPLDIPTREAGDRGLPVTAREEKSAVREAFLAIAQKLCESVRV